MESLLAKGARIDKEIGAVFPKSGTPNLEEAVWYHLATGGKRVRPALAIATYEALGGKGDIILPFAAACEILHAWLLVHDDIEDGDEVRRDKPALWKKYGMAHGINDGDYMAQKVYELILRSKRYGMDNETIFRLVEAMVTTSVKTAEGQAKDINLRDVDAPTEKQYMEMIRGKTGYYLTVPIVGGAIAAGADDDTVKKIIKYGSFVGPLFQITDDVIDVTDGKGRGETGRDIKEGKKSILVVHCLTKASNEEKKKLLAILKKPPAETANGDVTWAKALFERHGSIEYARKKAAVLAGEARKIAKDVEPALGEIMVAFADFLVTRKK